MPEARYHETAIVPRKYYGLKSDMTLLRVVVVSHDKEIMVYENRQKLRK